MTENPEMAHTKGKRLCLWSSGYTMDDVGGAYNIDKGAIFLGIEGNFAFPYNLPCMNMVLDMTLR